MTTVMLSLSCSAEVIVSEQNFNPGNGPGASPGRPCPLEPPAGESYITFPPCPPSGEPKDNEVLFDLTMDKPAYLVWPLTEQEKGLYTGTIRMTLTGFTTPSDDWTCYDPECPTVLMEMEHCHSQTLTFGSEGRGLLMFFAETGVLYFENRLEQDKIHMRALHFCPVGP